jgi:hypothetical protein
MFLKVCLESFLQKDMAMGKHRVVAMGILAVLGFVAASCTAKAVSMEKFRISNQIPGWVEEKKSYRSFIPGELYDLIDGDAPKYIDNGLKEGFFQRLKRPDSAIIELYAEDFGSEENARKIFAAKRSDISGSLPAETPDTSTVFIQEVIGGLWACGTAGRYYFELNTTGIKDTSKATEEIKKYFDYYRKIASSKLRN